jgi:Mg-chelatase subunit ChlD
MTDGLPPDGGLSNELVPDGGLPKEVVAGQSQPDGGLPDGVTGDQAAFLDEAADSSDEAGRRWSLMLGMDQDLNPADRRLSAALGAVYGSYEPDEPGKTGRSGRSGKKPDKSSNRRGGLNRSSPKALATWLSDVRELLPRGVAQVVQRDALERLGLKQLLMEPEVLESIDRDVNLVADLIALSSVIPDKSKQVAREVVAEVVRELMKRLEQRTAEAIRGALDRSRRTNRPRPADIDWPRTITANLRHYQPEYRSVVPERLIGFLRHQRRISDLDEVVMCVDQSGSMASSVVYASIFSAVMASIPAIATKLICFDTAVVDLTSQLADPVDVLFGVQLGGGTDINQAVAYCAEQIERPSKTHLILLTDLFEGGNAKQLLQRLARLVRSGVNVICLLALTDQGDPGFDSDMAGKVAALNIPSFGCTPDQFPDLMAAALRHEDVAAWAATADIALIRPAANPAKAEQTS